VNIRKINGNRIINSVFRIGKTNLFRRFTEEFVFYLSLAFSLAVLSGCDEANTGAGVRTAEQENERLVVFAAASLTETLSEIGKSYEKTHPGVKVVFNFDSSGTLKTQIAEGAVSDIFISAASRQMDQLDISAGEAKNPKKLDYVLSESRINLLENRVVLAVSKSSGTDLKSFDELAAALKEHRVFLAVGNSDVPVGQYTLRIFDYYGIDTDELFAHKSLTLGSSVKEVTAQIREGVADAGIVYATDAYSADLRIIDAASVEMAGQVIYPAAVLKNSKHRRHAEEFLGYLKNDESKRIFESVGFTVVGR
jgi:molybdate transport system substrate-binding protein